jgi:glycosyltransferase involved in cell wall biosynthesis
MKPGHERNLTVLLISHSNGFPYGLATTQRMGLVARALSEGGVRPKILLTRATDRPPIVANERAQGEWMGVPFEYTTGTSVRSTRFFIRRWTTLRGVLGAAIEIASGWHTGSLDCVYLWMDDRERLTFRTLRGLCALLGVPVVCELSEPSRAVWEGAPLLAGAGRRDPLLAHVDGFVVISAGLEEWVRSRKNGARPAVLRLPVLVDTREVAASLEPAIRSDVFYAAAPAYLDEITFVLDVVDVARGRCPDLRVRFSGWQIEDLARPELRDRLRSQVAAGHAVVEGVLSRERLLQSYKECAALLLPMKDEPRSFARCPTKIGEYLASGRPVVATAIGELGALLSDGENAFLAEPGGAGPFADAVLTALADPDRADAVGRAGHDLAEQKLDYRRYAEPLRDFFTSLRPARTGS